MSILGPDGNVTLPASGKVVKNPIDDIRIMVFTKMIVHPQTKEMVNIPMQDFQYKRVGSEEWFSVPLVQTENHEFNPEDKDEKDYRMSSLGVS